jgi:hypothetical protein
VENGNPAIARRLEVDGIEADTRTADDSNFGSEEVYKRAGERLNGHDNGVRICRFSSYVLRRLEGSQANIDGLFREVFSLNRNIADGALGDHYLKGTHSDIISNAG